MSQDLNILFTPPSVGSFALKNRIVMAPMTRCRAIGNVPNGLMAQYYADRADAGLLITEGTSPSPNGLGYARIPGLFNEAQVKGWKTVTDAVHAKGGKMVVQLMHVGRIGHPLNLPEGAELISASAIAPATTQMWTDQQQMQPVGVPRELRTDEIPALINEYADSAKKAIEAGFDGVEIHAANGYLPMQFLNESSNQRTDNYGGNPENRNRFVLELTAAVATAIGKDKTGIRLSPFGPFNDMAADGITEEQYLALTAGLKKEGIAYLHLFTYATPPAFVDTLKATFGGTVMLNGGYTAEKAEADLADGRADLISFGNSYIANPDLVQRFKKGIALAKADPATFYSADEKGYTDYAFAG